MRTKIQAEIPLLIPIPYRARQISYGRDAIENLRTATPVTTSLEEVGGIEISITVPTGKSATARFRQLLGEGLPGLQGSLIRFSSTVDVGRETLTLESSHGNVETIEGAEAYRLRLHWLAHEFRSAVYRMLTVANISRPGGFAAAEGLIRCGTSRSGYELETKRFAAGLFEIRSDADKWGWPTIQDLNFREVWTWASANHGFVEGLGGGRMGRALNAFTHLFDGSGSYLDILWAVMALESLYVDSEDEKKKARQLRERTQSVLGTARSRHRSRLWKAYDMRSRLVHGDVDIPALHFEHDATPRIRSIFESVLGGRGLCQSYLGGYPAGHGRTEPPRVLVRLMSQCS